MSEEIPLTGLTTDQLLVRTITVLNTLSSQVKKITQTFESSEDLHWTCVFFPGRNGEGPKLIKDVETIKTEIATTKAYIAGGRRGLWIAVLVLGALNLGQLSINLPAIFGLLRP